MAFIIISENFSSTGTPTAVITATNISGSQDLYMMPVIYCFVGTPINLTSGGFSTGTDLSASILYFVNRTTGGWQATYFTNDMCVAN